MADVVGVTLEWGEGKGGDGQRLTEGVEPPPPRFGCRAARRVGMVDRLAQAISICRSESRRGRNVGPGDAIAYGGPQSYSLKGHFLADGARQDRKSQTGQQTRHEQANLTDQTTTDPRSLSGYTKPAQCCANLSQARPSRTTCLATPSLPRRADHYCPSRSPKPLRIKALRPVPSYPSESQPHAYLLAHRPVMYICAFDR